VVALNERSVPPRRSRWPRARRLLTRVIPATVVIAIVIFALTPTGCYLSRAGWEEAKILAGRRPIPAIVADPTTDAATRAKLSLVLEARDYAKDWLGLDVEESFTTYSQLERDTLVLLVSAAYRDRLVPYTWWFPIVGRVPYKGFFDFDAARALAAELRNDGFDTNVRPASAFSTLGWFNDPLLSTTLDADSLDLVNTVIHEVTHNSYYGAGEADFNESFANFVGARGAEAFFRARGDTAAANETVRRWEDERILARFWGTLYRSLDSAFAAHPTDRAARLAARDTLYARARQTLIAEIGPQLRTVSPRYAERVTLDNAALLARRVYLSDLELFERAYEREGRDLRRTISRLIEIARGSGGKPFDALRTWLGGAGAGG
jgi:predicted aminopeptidase